MGEIPSIERDKPMDDHEEQIVIRWADIDSLMKMLSDLPREIADQEQKVGDLLLEQDRIANRMKDIEMAMYQDASNETDESGKKVYTNEKGREFGTNVKLKENTEYNLLQDTTTSMAVKLYEAKAKMQQYKNTMRVIETMTDLMKIKHRIE